MTHQLRRRTDSNVSAVVRGSDGDHRLQFGTEDWIDSGNAESFQFRRVRKLAEIGQHRVVAEARQTCSYTVCGLGLPAITDAIATAFACSVIDQPEQMLKRAELTMRFD